MIWFLPPPWSSKTLISDGEMVVSLRNIRGIMRHLLPLTDQLVVHCGTAIMAGRS